jgi:1,4-dihydroxy-2-naphthoate octaprenyltransferase
VATLAQWVQGARPRTLPTAVSPVLVGTGAAVGAGVFAPGRAVLALVVALALVVGVNYANDYSDGVRGTDDERVGPVRLVGSRLATGSSVRTAAFACFGIAAVAGLVLVVLSGQWWLLVVGALCIAGAWFYTGGARPYGYAGLGEVAVFVFFGPVAVLGTLLTQAGSPARITVGAAAVATVATVATVAAVAAVAVGALTSAVLVANNLRDIPTDAVVGKRTLAVALGDHRTRTLYAVLALGPFAFSLLGALVAWPLLLGLVAVPLAVGPVRRVLGGATGRDLVAVLAGTGVLLLGWSAATGAGLALTRLV